jgi:F-type H+-transporting ATPase subunit alpha
MKSFTDSLNEHREIGFVLRVNGVMAYVAGLPSVRVNELVIFEDNSVGEVLSIDGDGIEVMVFSKTQLKAKMRVSRTDRSLTIAVGESLLGATIDPFGQPLNADQYLHESSAQVPLKNEAWGINRRKRINKPFETGVSLVDLVVPLGQGQRQLIVGDRKTGKTTFVLQTILLQAAMGTICIYAGIGRKKAEIKRIEEYFVQKNISHNTIIVATSSNDPASLIYLTPYAAMAIAEYFRDQGKNVLLVLDDLVSHAKFYREISLLSGRFPGRNSYPADIFFVHSQLLERAGNFVTSNGDASITAFVIAETAQGDLSGYIQTNIMSMTDGHIFFDEDLFIAGRRPAVNSFLSVTRVGKQVQGSLRRDINRELTSFFTYAQRLRNFTHFGEEATQTVRNVLDMESSLNGFFTQPAQLIIPATFQVFIIALIWQNRWKGVSRDVVDKEILELLKIYETDVAVRGSIDKLVAETTTLNDFLGRLMKADLGILRRG